MNLPFRFHIHAGSGIVKNQDGRVDQHGAGNGQALALAAGQSAAAFPHPGIIAIGQVHYLVVQLGDFGGVDNVRLGGVGHPVGNVVPDGGVKEKNILLDNAHIAAQGFQGELPDVHAVDGHPAVGNIIKAGQQVDDSAFAAARRAQDGGYLPRFGGNVDAFQGRGTGVISKGCLVKLYPARSPPHRPGFRLFLDGRTGIQNIKDAAARGNGPGKAVDNLSGGTDGKGQLIQVQHELRQIPGGQIAADDFPAAVPDNQAQGKGEIKGHPGAVGALQPFRLIVFLAQFPGLAVILPPLKILGGKGFDHMDSDQVFLQDGYQFAVDFLHMKPHPAQLAHHQSGAHHQKGNKDQAD